MARRDLQQVSFADGLVNQRAGRNSWMDEIDKLIDWSAVVKLLGDPPAGASLNLPSGEMLLDHGPAGILVHADKGYDTNRISRLIKKGRQRAEHPAESQSALEELLFAIPLPSTQRDRTDVWMPKDFRRIATRYDRLAQNYLAAVCLAAIVCYR